MNINCVIIGGNLVRDPEFKVLKEKPYAEFSLAINGGHKDAQGQWVDEVDFISVFAWGRLAEVSRDYLKKGAACIIEGRLKQDRWEDAEGKKHSKTKVRAKRIQLVGKKAEEVEE